MTLQSFIRRWCVHEKLRRPCTPLLRWHVRDARRASQAAAPSLAWQPLHASPCRCAAFSLPSMSLQRNIRAKVLIAGDAASGKTALCKMLASNGTDFPKNYVTVSRRRRSGWGAVQLLV